MDVSDRLFTTTTKCFDAKTNGPAEEEVQVAAEPAAPAGPPKARKGHVTTTPVEPEASDLAAYKEGLPSPGSPLRIVTHTVVHAREQKHNPDLTHRGRIRNTSGGFYNS